jgi:protein BUR2
MKPIEIQHPCLTDSFLFAHTSAFDEHANDFTWRPTASPVAKKHQSRDANMPPTVPSPPSHSSRRSPPRISRVSNIPPLVIMAAGESDSQNQWMFTEEEIHNSPSILDGLTFTEESCRRAKGVNFITQAGILLKIPQLTLGTAAVFFHRFYMRCSMVIEKGGIHHYVSSVLSWPTFFQF